MGGVERVGKTKIVKGAGDRASIGAREIRGIQMDAQNHIGSPIDLATIRVGRDETKTTVETRDGCEGGGRCSEARAQVAVRMLASTFRP
jgi:hypothetical protein